MTPKSPPRRCIKRRRPSATIRSFPGPSTVRVGIDGDRRFLVDGEPFIPIAAGWDGLASPAVVQHLAQAGFNTICLSLDRSLTNANVRPFLDSTQSNGLKVIMWIQNVVSTSTLDWITNLKGSSGRDHLVRIR